MIEEIIAEVTLSALANHILKWFTNLRRAGPQRKLESRACLEKVILAVRKTAVYCRALDEGHPKSYDKETEIAQEWTGLSLELERLRIQKLAKKCHVKGRYWENPNNFDDKFLSEAQISFEQIEIAAYALLRGINA